MKPLLALALALALLAAPFSAAVAQTACTGSTYKVSAGETLYSIAERCRISYLVLVSINVEMKDPDRIFPGQIIRLVAEAPLEFFQQPESGPAQPYGLQPGGEIYIIRQGDSLARIAFLYDTTLDELLAANPLLNGGGDVVPGQAVVMPPGARKDKGWVGVSTLAAEGSDTLQVRVVDFPSYADIQFRLGVREEGDYAYETVNARTDAVGEAHAKISIPWFAWRGEIWEVHAVTRGEAAGEHTNAVSAGIRITN